MIVSLQLPAPGVANRFGAAREGVGLINTGMSISRQLRAWAGGPETLPIGKQRCCADVAFTNLGRLLPEDRRTIQTFSTPKQHGSRWTVSTAINPTATIPVATGHGVRSPI